MPTRPRNGDFVDQACAPLAHAALAPWATSRRPPPDRRPERARRPIGPRGQALGNPRLAEARATVNATRTAGADTFAAAVAPVIAEARAAGAKSLRQIAAALNGRGVATARGGRWEAATVANVLKRVAA